MLSLCRFVNTTCRVFQDCRGSTAQSKPTTASTRSNSTWVSPIRSPQCAARRRAARVWQSRKPTTRTIRNRRSRTHPNSVSGARFLSKPRCPSCRLRPLQWTTVLPMVLALVSTQTTSSCLSPAMAWGRRRQQSHPQLLATSRRTRFAPGTGTGCVGDQFCALSRWTATCIFGSFMQTTRPLWGTRLCECSVYVILRTCSCKVQFLRYESL